jgi:hypothetical protein
VGFTVLLLALVLVPVLQELPEQETAAAMASRGRRSVLIDIPYLPTYYGTWSKNPPRQGPAPGPPGPVNRISPVLQLAKPPES